MATNKGNRHLWFSYCKNKNQSINDCSIVYLKTKFGILNISLIVNSVNLFHNSLKIYFSLI
jgi:hypothetical protein